MSSHAGQATCSVYDPSMGLFAGEFAASGVSLPLPGLPGLLLPAGCSPPSLLELVPPSLPLVDPLLPEFSFGQPANITTPKNNIIQAEKFRLTRMERFLHEVWQ